MIRKNMAKKYVIIMIGTMLIVMVPLFMILGTTSVGSMVSGIMMIIMAVMLGLYILVMFALMKPKKGHHLRLNCVKCGQELSPSNFKCTFCGHENKMSDFHKDSSVGGEM